MSTESIETITLADGREVQAGQLVLYGARECRVARNGALIDTETHRFVTPPAPGYSRLEPVRTTEQAIALNNARWHAPRQAAAVSAVQDASGNDALDTIDLADSYMMQAIIKEIVLDVDVRADHRVKAWQAVLEQAGMDGRAPKQVASSSPDTTIITIANDLIRDIVAAAMRRGDG